MLKPYLELPRQVHVLCLGTLINRAGMLLLPFLTLYLTANLHMPKSFATFTMGAFGLGAMGAGLVGGHLADVIGRRTTMLISLLGGACVLLLFGSLKSPWAIYTAVLAFAFLGEMYRPAASAMIADLVPPDRRSFAYGLLYIAINLGCAVGPIIGGHLAKFSFRWLFLADAGTAIAYALVIAVAARETLPSRRRASGEGGPAGAAEPAVTLAQAAAHIARDYRFLLFCLGALLMGTLMMQTMSTFPLHLTALGYDTATYGNIVAVNAVMVVLLQIPLNTVLSKYHRGHVLAMGALLTGVGFSLIGLGRTPIEFVGAVVVFTFGELMQAPMIPSVTGDLAPANMRGRYMGMVGVCFSGATAFGVPLGGFVLERYGPGVLWGSCLGLGIVATTVNLAILKHLKKPVQAKCVGCGYSLAGAAPGACPECGASLPGAA